MKKIIKLFILILCLFCIPLITDAASGKITAGDISMECIYDNGKILNVSYKNGAYGISLSDLKLAYALIPSYSNSLTFVYKESEVAKKILDNVECPTKIQSTLLEQKAEAEDINMQFELLFTDDYQNTLMQEGNHGLVASLKYISGFKVKSGSIVGVEVDANSPLGKRVLWFYESNDEEIKNSASFYFNLVSERIYFEKEVEPKYTWAFKYEGQQAASTPQYIRVYQYINPKGDYFKLAEQNKIITRVTLNASRYDSSYVNFICFKPTVKSIVNDKSDMAYTFNEKSHTVKNLTRKTLESVIESNYLHKCEKGFLPYREVNALEVPPEPSSGTSICEVLPETALLISTVIYYLGLIIPVFLIILTGIDIGKLVISGEIEEELPKRRKLIIVRFIVAVAFFFIPIFLNLFVSSNYGTDFGDVSCLFAKNATTEETGSEAPVDEEV